MYFRSSATLVMVCALLAPACERKFVAPQNVGYNVPFALLADYRREVDKYCAAGQLTQEDCYNQRIKILEIEGSLIKQSAQDAANELDKQLDKVTDPEAKGFLKTLAFRLKTALR